MPTTNRRNARLLLADVNEHSSDRPSWFWILILSTGRSGQELEVTDSASFPERLESARCAMQAAMDLGLTITESDEDVVSKDELLVCWKQLCQRDGDSEP